MTGLARWLVATAVWSRWLWLVLALAFVTRGQPGLVVLLVPGTVWVLWRGGRWRPTDIDFGGLLGTARLATTTDLVRAGQVGPGGLFLGTLPLPGKEARALLWSTPRWLDRDMLTWLFTPWRKRRVPVALHGVVNAAIFAPTGVGKSTAFIIPWLLQNPFGSAVVLDVAGELSKATAATRKRFGNRIRVLDPYGTLGGTDRCNPLGDLSWHDTLLLDKCRQTADALVVRTGEEKDPHWNESAAVVIAAAIAFQVALADDTGKRRGQSLGEVFALIADTDRLTTAMGALAATRAHGGTVAALAKQVLGLKGEERASVLSSALRHLAFANTVATRAVTDRSTFDPKDLRAATPTTVYLVIPPTALSEKKGLIRAWLTTFLRACVDAGPTRERTVTFVLDEYAALGGQLDVIDAGLVQLRKYGCRFLFAFQARDQLEQSFKPGGANVLLANATQIYLGTQDYATAELVSKQIGRATVANPTFSGGENRSTSRNSGGSDHSTNTSDGWNRGWSVSAVQREILQPEEVLQLPSDTAVTFTPGLPPILTRAVPHFRPEYRTLFDSGRGVVVQAMTLGVIAWAALIAAAVAVAARTPGVPNRTPQPVPPGWVPTPPASPVWSDPELALPGDWVRDGFGLVVTDRFGRPLVVPMGCHVEIDPNSGAAWVVPDGRRMFPPMWR